MELVPVNAKGLPARFCPTHLVIHYNEIALKGKNRDWFEDKLVRNMRRALAAELLPAGSANLDGAASGWRVQRLFGRILLGPEPGNDWARTWQDAIQVLTRVYGIAYILPVCRLEPIMDVLKDAARDALTGDAGVRTFAVQCRRATKDFPFNSMDVQREVGARVRELTGWGVDLENPDRTLRFECVNKSVYFGFARYDGPGGLPTGVAGKVVCLLSGGIDSPVAAQRLLRRGVTAVYVHYHSYPHTGPESQEKVLELAERITPPGVTTRLYMVPFADTQKRIVVSCPAPYRVILYRRFMLRVAEAIAEKEGALALVTGDNLGQVASQTLENIRTIEAVAGIPVLRPLVGLDKQEIVEEAKEIGTFDISIEPHDDCCSFLMPPNPATHSTPGEIEAAEGPIDVSAEVARLVAAAEIRDVGRRWVARPAAAEDAASRGPANADLGDDGEETTISPRKHAEPE